MSNGGESVEFLLLSIVIRLLYFIFGNNPRFRHDGKNH
ncbi:Uncharacterised protein [Serratia entomophila]|nr:Uncharacterised protein [Serratia entomophila]CAI0856119.1 Uncharacterised protein [Serratia entomophila]CAI0858063.1 Uncharacterised protein [Serratia entomophila]CAI1045338.1 Uncharacterised protein [Serratia entomophila]CAI1535128.1 Uncharacterised protein [Serratia entomophila]